MTLTTLMMVISMLISTPMMMLVTGVSHTSWLLTKLTGTQSAIEAMGTVKAAWTTLFNKQKSAAPLRKTALVQDRPATASTAKTVWTSPAAATAANPTAEYPGAAISAAVAVAKESPALKRSASIVNAVGGITLHASVAIN